jgi:hypothetical protein
MSRLFLVAATAVVITGGVAALLTARTTEIAHLPEAAMVEPAPTVQAELPAPLKKLAPGDDYLSQSYGTICETPRGECTVSPKPINSLCSCNGAPGKIIR